MASRSPVEALHTAFRRRAIRRFNEWSTRYRDLRARGGRDREFAYTYIPEDYEIFPRYLVDSAMLDEAERWVPADFDSLEAARSTLKEVAMEASDRMVDNVDTPSTGARAIADERADFVAWLDRVTESDLDDVEPLGYRRTLSDDEIRVAVQQLEERFDVRGRTWWPEPIADTCVLREEAFISGPGTERLRHALESLSIDRVLEIREYGRSCDVDLDLVNVTYNLAEVLVTPPDYSWMIYTSHESTVAFTEGDLLDRLRATWLELDQWRWAPPSLR